MARAAGDPQVSVHQISVPLLTGVGLIITIISCVWYLSGILGQIQTTLAVSQSVYADHGRRIEDLERWQESFTVD